MSATVNLSCSFLSYWWGLNFLSHISLFSPALDCRRIQIISFFSFFCAFFAVLFIVPSITGKGNEIARALPLRDFSVFMVLLGYWKNRFVESQVCFLSFACNSHRSTVPFLFLFLFYFNLSIQYTFRDFLSLNLGFQGQTLNDRLVF